MSTTTLVLAPSKEFPRELNITWSEYGIRVFVYLKKTRARLLAFAHGRHKHDQVYLSIDQRVLWISSAAFDLTATECERIRREFEPLGLRMDSPPAAAPSAAAANEATAAVIGERGTSPPPVCTGGSALEAEALVSREAY